jgi:Flp pilus assembly protein TadG
MHTSYAVHTAGIPRARRNRRGITAVLVVLIATVLMGIAAFAIDLSRMYAYQSELQRAADAAAHGGAIELTKANFDAADSVATLYVDTNTVEGDTATIDSIEFGVWDPTQPDSTAFTSLCTSPCSAALADSANAMRVSLSGGPTSPIFGGFAGQDSMSGTQMKASAIAWVAPTTARHDCTKPLGVNITALTQMLDNAEGRPGFNLFRQLDSTDVATIRTGGAALQMCLIVNTTDVCNPTTPAAPTFDTSFVPVQLYPAVTGVTDEYLNELEEQCAATETVGPGEVMQVDSTVLTAYVPGDTQTGWSSWCELYGFPTNPCLMKLDTWDTTTVTPGATATDDSTCTPNKCKSIHEIVAFMVTGISEPGQGNTNAYVAIQGYPTLGIDGAAISDTASTLSRVVLVH